MKRTAPLPAERRQKGSVSTCWPPQQAWSLLQGSAVRLFVAVALTSVLLPGDLGATDCAGPPELVATSLEGLFKAVLPAREGQASVWRLSPDDAWEASHTVDLSSLEVTPHQVLIGDDGWLVTIERWCYGGGPLAMVWDASGKFRYRIDHDALPEAYRPTWHSQPAVSPYHPPFIRRDGRDEQIVVTLPSEHRVVVRLTTSEMWVEEVEDLPDEPDILVARAESLCDIRMPCSHLAEDVATALPVVRLLRRALEVDRNHAQARLMLADRLYRESAFLAARQLLESAIDRTAWVAEETPTEQRFIALALARQLDETGGEREALALLQELSAAFPEDVAGPLATAYFRAGAEREAAETVQGWLEGPPGSRSAWDRSFRSTQAGRLFAQMGMWSLARLAYRVAMDSGRGSYYDELAYAESLWCDGSRAEGEEIVARVLEERGESLGDHTRKSLRDKLAHGFQCVWPVRSSRAARREPPVISPSEPSIQPEEALRRLEELEDRQGGAEVLGFQRSLIIHRVDPSSSDQDGLLRIVLAGLRDPSGDAAQAATWLAVKASLGTQGVLEAGHLAVRAGTLGLGLYGGFTVLDHSPCFESVLGRLADLAPVP